MATTKPNLLNAQTGKGCRMASTLSPYVLFRTYVNAGDLVVCHEIKGFDGGRMGAIVLADSAMHRPAREGTAWVRESGLSVTCDPFVTEWPIRLMA